ncbi:MAG: biosynthetic-type acetolactate synthase large subunit [Thermanaerothrix sp.]|nr:biosynthetic-type acetolactate synthase large subunit [Thermanaerothrix sp.]
MSSMNGAAITVKALEELGVTAAFGIPGGPVIPLYDRLHHSPIRHVLTRHEQAAAHGADAYGRLTGRPGLCIATSGPGATNLLTGLANAYLDSSPMVALVGQVPRWAIGSDAFQEADVMGAALSMVKHSFRAASPRDIPAILKGAFYLASTGRPGPVLVEIPLDVQRAEGDYSMPRQVSFRGYRTEEDPDFAWADRTAELVMKSQRPLILAGGGVVRDFAFQQLLRLSEEANLPVATTLMGKGAFPEDHPLSLGLVGMHGTARGNRALGKADLIIAVGVRFSDRTTGDREAFGRNAAIVHLDIDPSEHRKNIGTALHATVSAKRAIATLLDRLRGWRALDWAPQDEAIPQSRRADDGQVHPWQVMRALMDITKGEAVFTTEVGQNQMWAALHLKVSRPGSFITSGGLGTMGFGLPAAMGAAVAEKSRPVVCIAGDGSLMMNIQELDTLARYNLPVKVVLLNNRCLGMVRQWQQLFFEGRYSNTLYDRSPDFPGMAEAMGVRGLRVERAEQLIGALEAAFQHPGPALVDIWIPREDLVMPMVPPGGALEEMMTEYEGP